MKHRWLILGVCAWILWEAEVDPKTSLDKKMFALEGYDSKAECLEAAEKWAKKLDNVAGILASEKLQLSDFSGPLRWNRVGP